LQNCIKKKRTIAQTTATVEDPAKEGGIELSVNDTSPTHHFENKVISEANDFLNSCCTKILLNFLELQFNSFIIG
jgi:hypothetical protein